MRIGYVAFETLLAGLVAFAGNSFAQESENPSGAQSLAVQEGPGSASEKHGLNYVATSRAIGISVANRLPVGASVDLIGVNEFPVQLEIKDGFSVAGDTSKLKPQKPRYSQVFILIGAPGTTRDTPQLILKRWSSKILTAKAGQSDTITLSEKFALPPGVYWYQILVFDPSNADRIPNELPWIPAEDPSFPGVFCAGKLGSIRVEATQAAAAKFKAAIKPVQLKKVEAKRLN